MAIKMAVIGTGIMGKNAINVWKRNSDVEVTAICNLEEEVVKNVAKEHNIADWFTDHRKLLESVNVDAVHVNTPDWAHRDVVIDSLAAGKHVLVEKPMTTEVAE
ncbi:MAG: Gfo/Idh/MocA family oxidoreductase, partial [Bacteroidetes bacterium]|nr:Gfo/Idh/MocA family oxidoreductase [Bacteroidota bacterium]